MANAQVLIDAIRTNNAQALEAMIAEGQNLNIRNEKGNTLLHIAAFYGHGDVCQMLLDAGADMHVENKDGCSAMQMAADRVIHPTPDDNGQRAVALLAIFVNQNADAGEATVGEVEGDNDGLLSEGVIEAIDEAVGAQEPEKIEEMKVPEIAEDESSSEDLAKEMEKEPKAEKVIQEAKLDQVEAPAVEAPVAEAPEVPQTPAVSEKMTVETAAETQAPEASKAEEVTAPQAAAPEAPKPEVADKAAQEAPADKPATAEVPNAEVGAPEAAPKAEGKPVDAPKAEATPTEAPEAPKASSGQAA